MKLDQNYLNYYFEHIWYRKNGGLSRYKHTGLSLVDRVGPTETVIDVGCGVNPFKSIFKDRLIGIDPAFDQSDYRVTLDDYHSDQQFDVAFCLGSINFGDHEHIVNQIKKLTVELLKPKSRIYWRCNPGLQDHSNSECKNITFYPWSFDKHIELSEQFGYKIRELLWDTGNRIYSEWIRN